ncbi:hypothetical protein [Nocardiopsis sp. FR6]|uniref:hypothetical protein n=1 Tax=Nocardiopsis sp. FR6 TaxID=2605986 RepID=UPI001357897C|nr:hypothetical protein [Nocardiopsis sp. FR6]
MADGGTMARLVARTLERRHVTRAGVTRISVLVAVGAAVWFSRADALGGLAGSALLGAVLFCDAVRGRMRADRRDALTLWLAAMLSQLREYAVYLGLAAGAVLAGVNGAWGWAAGALVALALRDSLLAAETAPAAPGAGRTPKGPVPPSQGRQGGFLSALTPQPPQGPRKSDPDLTSRLFGTTVATAPGGVATGASGAGGGSGESGRAGDGRSGPARRPEASSSPVSVSAPVHHLVTFSQPVRFAVIAVTVTLWDARVAFVTLIFGCAIAVTARVVGPTAPGVPR